MKTLEEMRLADVLPGSLAHDQTVRPAAAAIDPQLTAVAGLVDMPALYTQLDRLPSLALDHLAMQFDLTVWRDSWSLTMKRRVLKNALYEKANKGTVKAVKNALDALGSDAVIKEWWETEPKGTPHTFSIVATQTNSGEIVDSELQEDIIATINDTKPLRSHFSLTVEQASRGQIGIYGCVRALACFRVSGAAEGRNTWFDIDTGIGMASVGRPMVKRHLIATA
ncbi:MAG: phage tail protein I [Candidatus Spyradenecus sp.]